MLMQQGCSPDLLTVLHSTQVWGRTIYPPSALPNLISFPLRIKPDAHTHVRLTWTTTPGLFLILRNVDICHSRRGEGGNKRLRRIFFLLLNEDDMLLLPQAQSSEQIIGSLVEVQSLRGEAWRQRPLRHLWRGTKANMHRRNGSWSRCSRWRKASCQSNWKNSFIVQRKEALCLLNASPSPWVSQRKGTLLT